MADILLKLIKSGSIVYTFMFAGIIAGFFIGLLLADNETGMSTLAYSTILGGLIGGVTAAYLAVNRHC